VSHRLSDAVNHVVFTTMRSHDHPLTAGGPKNIRNQVQVSSPIEHWGSRSPQNFPKLQLQPRSCCCCWQLNQSWTVKAVPQPATPTHLWSPRRNQCAPVIHLRAV
jgi:hypothetical protein